MRMTLWSAIRPRTSVRQCARKDKRPARPNVTASMIDGAAQVTFDHAARAVAMPIVMESLGTADEDFMNGLSVQLLKLALKAPECRYAVLAYATRSPTRRPLEKGEKPPQDADINDDGVLTFGRAYVLKALPCRLKSKAVEWQ